MEGTVAVKEKECYECPKCKEFSYDEEWNKSTLELCQNRKARRDYIPFESPMFIHKKKNTHYKCPRCGNVVSRLTVRP